MYKQNKIKMYTLYILVLIFKYYLKLGSVGSLYKVVMFQSLWDSVWDDAESARQGR